MTLRDITVFQKVCETGSLTAAAKALFMTQPAVSHVIRALEEETGVRLFDRAAGGVILNQYGMQFLRQAEDLLDAYGRLKLFPSAYESPPVRVGSNITIACFRLTGFLKEFQKSHPGARLQVTVDTAAGIFKRLLSRELDVALLEGPLPPGPYETVPFDSYRIVPACAPDYLPPGVCCLSPSDLVREKLLLREKGSAVRDVFDSALFLRSLSAAPFMTSVDSQALIRAAESGLGITLLPDLILDSEFASGRLVSPRVDELDLRAQMQLVYYTSEYMAEAVRDFIGIIKGKADPNRHVPTV